jgi:hypothetical protein
MSENMTALNIKKHLLIGMILGLGWNLNLNAQLIQSGTLNNTNGVSQLDLGSESKGMYIIKLINNQKTEVQKVQLY